jgi:UDP-N-acetylglucosamine/UDP-N-acetylgalactosamine 4-epimerase
MTAYDDLQRQLPAQPRRWLVTGAAGFIGSHLVEKLLRLGQEVTGLDNFATGHQANLDDVKRLVGTRAWQRFTFVQGDIRNLDDCARACRGAQIVLHQAALGSVPRSLADPATSNAVNVGGFVNMMLAARDEGAQRVVYAASSSTYGDHAALPKVEHTIGKPLSPYAVTKLANELYADVFARAYRLSCIGLRYFNVFGPRQDPEGAYAAVIPRWAAAMLAAEPTTINGDGTTSRDFCFVDNAVQANLLAAVVPGIDAEHRVYNVAVGEQTSLVQLHEALARELRALQPSLRPASPVHRDFRAGDVRHSLADIGKARRELGYEPTHRVGEGLAKVAAWFVERSATR